MKTSMIKVQFVATVVIAFFMSACGEKEFYTDEQYRKECYIVSDDNNVFGQEYTFGQPSTGYLSVYLSGSVPTDHDVTVTLRENDAYLKSYNQSVYGSTYANYAELLPSDCFTVPDGWQATLTSANAYTMFPITVNIDKLDSEKAYILPIEIAKVSDYQFSEDKSYVLFKVYMKNDYATTKSDTYYQMYGTTLDLLKEEDGLWSEASEGASATAFNATKKAVPIDENTIRMMPGANTSNDATIISQRSICVSVTDEEVFVDVLGDDGLPTGETKTMLKVNIYPWYEGANMVLVNQSCDDVDQDGNQPLVSYYDRENKQFTLYYCYRLPDEMADTAEKWHKVKEILTLLDY